MNAEMRSARTTRARMRRDRGETTHCTADLTSEAR
jgi:hypothetical protein